MSGSDPIRLGLTVGLDDSGLALVLIDPASRRSLGGVVSIEPVPGPKVAGETVEVRLTVRAEVLAPFVPAGIR